MNIKALSQLRLRGNARATTSPKELRMDAPEQVNFFKVHKFRGAVIFVFLVFGFIGFSWSGIVSYYNVKTSWNHLMHVINFTAKSDVADQSRGQIEEQNGVAQENDPKANFQSKRSDIEISKFYEDIGVKDFCLLDLSAVSPLLLIYFFGSMLVGSCLALTRHTNWAQSIKWIQDWLGQKRFPFVPSYQFYLMQIGLLGTIIGMTEGYATLAHSEDSRSMIVSLGAAFYSTLTAIVLAYVLGPPTGMIMRWAINNGSGSSKDQPALFHCVSELKETIRTSTGAVNELVNTVNVLTDNIRNQIYAVENIDALLNLQVRISDIETKHGTQVYLEETLKQLQNLVEKVRGDLTDLCGDMVAISGQQKILESAHFEEVKNRIASQGEQNRRIETLQKSTSETNVQWSTLKSASDADHNTLVRVLNAGEYLRLGEQALQMIEREKLEIQIAKLRANHEERIEKLKIDQEKFKEFMLLRVRHLHEDFDSYLIPRKTTPDNEHEQSVRQTSSD